MKKIILTLFMLLAIFALGACGDAEAASEVESVNVEISNEDLTVEDADENENQKENENDDEEESVLPCCLPDSAETVTEE